MIAVVAVSGTSILAQNNKKDLRKAGERVNKASDVIDEIMAAGDKSIPRDLLAKAKAIVVFPGALKLGFIIGGQGGSGIAIKRLKDGWSAPGFLSMGGGSFGPQVGGQKTDYILLIMNNNGLRYLIGDKVELGGEGSVSAGPVGRTAAASTDVRLDAEILTYSRSRGLFAGLSLKGVVISADDDLNLSLYKRSAKQLFGDYPLASADAPVSLQEFANTLAKYAK